MPRVQAPIFSPVYQNVDLVSLRDEGAEGYNFINDEKGSLERRPGVKLIDPWPSPIRAIYKPWNSVVISVDSLGNVRANNITGSTLSVGATTPSSGRLTAGSFIYSICQDRNNQLYFADGGYISYWNGSGLSPLTRLAVGPSLCTHVAFLDTYVLGLQSGGQTFYWSDVDDGLTWPGLNFAQAIGGNDWIVALDVFDRKIFLWGYNTLEVWANDGETPFVREPGGLYFNGGLGSQRGYVVTNRGPLWLNQNNRLCMWNGQVQELPGPFESVVSKISTANCSASLIYFRGRQMACWHFPAVNRTFVFDFNSQNPSWHEFSFYRDGIASGFPIMGCVNGTYEELALCTFEDRQGIYALDRSYYSDDSNGLTSTPVRGYRVSGPIDYGTNARKRSNGMKIRLKRGTDGSATRASGSVEPMIQIRFRDDGGAWSNYYNVGLGFQGETEIVVPIFNRGIFRTRQYELLATDAVPIVFGYAEEDLEVMSS